MYNNYVVSKYCNPISHSKVITSFRHGRIKNTLVALQKEEWEKMGGAIQIALAK